MAARFVDVSVSEIDQFKENAVPQKTKDGDFLKVVRLVFWSGVVGPGTGTEHIIDQLPTSVAS